MSYYSDYYGQPEQPNPLRYQGPSYEELQRIIERQREEYERIITDQRRERFLRHQSDMNKISRLEEEIQRLKQNEERAKELERELKEKHQEYPEIPGLFQAFNQQGETGPIVRAAPTEEQQIHPHYIQSLQGKTLQTQTIIYFENEIRGMIDRHYTVDPEAVVVEVSQAGFLYKFVKSLDLRGFRSKWGRIQIALPLHEGFNHYPLTNFRVFAADITYYISLILLSHGVETIGRADYINGSIINDIPPISFINDKYILIDFKADYIIPKDYYIGVSVNIKQQPRIIKADGNTFTTDLPGPQQRLLTGELITPSGPQGPRLQGPPSFPQIQPKGPNITPPSANNTNSEPDKSSEIDNLFEHLSIE